MMTNPNGIVTQGQFSFLPPLTDVQITQDRRDDLQLAAAVRAVLQVDLEHALE